MTAHSLSVSPWMKILEYWYSLQMPGTLPRIHHVPLGTLCAFGFFRAHSTRWLSATSTNQLLYFVMCCPMSNCPQSR